MKIRCAKDVIAIAKDRGFDIRVKPGPPPMPVLFAPAAVDISHATTILMEALKAWRLEIISELSGETT